MDFWTDFITPLQTLKLITIDRHQILKMVKIARAWYVGVIVNLFVISLRLLWLVWWTTLTMRMKRKKMRRRSNLQGSGPAWALKANCPLFGCGGRTLSPSHPPSFGRLIGPRPACATRQSHWGDGQRRAPTSLSPSWSLLLFFPKWKEMESFSFTGKKDRSVHSFSLSIFTSYFTNKPPPGDPEISFPSLVPLQTHRSSLSLHSLALPVLTSFWTTSYFLFCLNIFLLIHHPTHRPERLRWKSVPRRFPTLLCCYSNSSKEAVVLQQPHRNPHTSSFELSLPSFSNPNQWAPETEEARTQPASVRTVQRASQASRTSRHSYRKLDWLKPGVCATLPQNWSLLLGIEGSRQHGRNKTSRDKGGDKWQNVPRWILSSNEAWIQRSRTQTFKSHGVCLANAHTWHTLTLTHTHTHTQTRLTQDCVSQKSCISWLC